MLHLPAERELHDRSSSGFKRLQSQLTAVNILQANMHRGKVAHALLPQIVIEQKSDIIVISEQYSKMENGLWIEDDSGTAAIWIPGSSHLLPNTTGKGSGFVWAQFEYTTVLSCYLTPSDSIEDFEKKLDELEDTIRDTRGPLIVAGDLNCQAIEWGMERTNSRGRRMVELIARTGLAIANIGNVPTFRRPGCKGTIPDVTLVSERIENRIENWRVLEIYTASDHQYISFSLRDDNTTLVGSTNATTRKWNVKKLDASALIQEIARNELVTEIDGDANTITDRVMSIITKGCNKAMPKTKRPRNKTSVHWWNDSIDEDRRNCIRQRRIYTRARRRGEAEMEHMEYKRAKKRLQNSIAKSRKEKWEELREDINRDPWGLGYKLVMKKLGTRNPVMEIGEETMTNIVKSLFPTHERREESAEAEPVSDIPPFTLQEIRTAASSLRNNKAPGPDGIPAEVIKEAANHRPQMLLKMYNSCLSEGVFPNAWKEQRLVLVGKGKGDRNLPSAYRPLCMLNTAGKLLERLIKPRLEEAILAGGGLSGRQHGFRPGKSTIGALKDVVEVFEAAQTRNHYSRPVVLLATLDIKNAFNSLRWADVLHALRRNFNVPEYLMRIIKDYLNDRILIYNTREGIRRMQITSGAAQGSILGPDFWNVSYDGILKIEMPEDTFLVGYADDIAAVIRARTTDEAQRKLRQVMIRTKTWLDSHGLQLAMQKTELLLLTRRRIPVEMTMRMDEIVLTTRKYVKYLGVRLDSKLSYTDQIQYAVSKAARVTAQLSRLMANIGGPMPSRRKLLMETCNSILLYGCEIWAHTLDKKCNARKLLKVQRIAALRVISAYRSVSTSAALIIAGMIPIDIQAKERQKIYDIRRTNHQAGLAIQEVKEDSIERWQTRWNNEEQGRWTFKLIPNVRTWLRSRNMNVNYYITQMLSGHGYFRKYLYRIGKSSSPHCIYEEMETLDDAEHTFFQCTRWSENRRNLETETGEIAVETIMEIMTTSEENWNAVAGYVEYVLRTKKRDLDTAESIQGIAAGRLDAVVREDDA